MDLANVIKNINNLNEYIAATQDESEKIKIARIQLNMSTVLALKKIRSYEIEYVNKCEENGIACVIFERMLCLPPSKTWGVLSKEIVNLLQYWLDAVRKHLVKHSPHWWTFLKLLLKFIKEIRKKDSSVPNILVEHISECLLDLATTERPDAMQRYEILHCFNMYCSESSREIRFALRNQLGQYFTKIANYMSGCGNLATQYSILETLLRWLLPRQDRTLRITSATKWFPHRLYADKTVDIFVERSWINFFQDARDLLNSHNERSDLITSVVCRKVSVGDIVIISDSDKMDSWLDINASSKCMSVLLDPRVLDVFGCTNHKSFETFVVSEDNTHIAKLCRESNQTILSVQTITPPRVLPSCIKLGDDVSCHVTVVVTSRCDVKRLDAALRRIFDDKYQLLIDLEQEIPLSPLKATEHSNKNNKPDDPRFSHPIEVRKRVYHSGYMVRSRAPLSSISPSTASTSSLAQLHEKLAALPKYSFDKEPQTICALPELSIVSEASEFDERSTKTLNTETYTNCNKNQSTLDCNRKSQSDNETSRRYPDASRRGKFRQLSPIIKEDVPSCLLVATVGSAEDSVINDTVEKLSNNKDFNPDSIVDLLVQEALQANLVKEKDKNDSGINTGEKKSQEVSDNCDAIEDTPNAELHVNKLGKRCPKIRKVSSTSDESNTEAINETPNVYVNTSCRNKKNQSKTNTVERQSFDVQAVEEFFSQHFSANKEREIDISPSLAKKINVTSSENSDNFDFEEDDLRDVEPCDFNNIEVLECLNNIVDKVCDDFDKCTQYLNEKQDNAAVDDTSEVEDNLPLKDISNKLHNKLTKNKATVEKSNSIKLKYKVAPKKDKTKSRSIKRKNKLVIESVPKISIIVEDNAEIAPKNNLPNEPEENVKGQKETVSDIKYDSTTPQLRRKRKLFSPKDERITDEVRVEVYPQPEENEIKKTPKSTNDYKPYKEIEKERERHIRIPRNKKTKTLDMPSPRSKKMNSLFDKVKESADGEKITLVNKTSDLKVYNFSSDSEDNFKEKKIEMTKKTSNSILDSAESTVLKGKRVVKRVNSSNKKEPIMTKRKVNRRQKVKKEINIEPANDLIDERMRDRKDLLNTSIVETIPTVIVTEPKLVLEKLPKMEPIVHKEKPKRTRKNKAKAVDTVKVTKEVLNIKPKLDVDRTESPLPGLVVEEALTTNKEDADLSATMADKFKKICQNPEKYINESNTTQNLLSDNERILNSPQTADIIDDIAQNEIQIRNESKTKENTANSKKAKSVKGKKKIPKTSRVSTNAADITKSNESIATFCITGHGDSEEAPPSPEQIGERLKYRHLHTEYLERSTKNYFNKLTEEINHINDDNDSIIELQSSPSHSIKSPVVSVERLSLKDISRWLPSNRDSETDEYSQNSNKSKKSNYVSKIPENCANSQNDSEVQEAIRQSLKTSSRSPVFKVNKSHSKKSPSRSNKSKASDKSVQQSIETKKISKSRTQPSRHVKCTPKSIISPIKLFEDLVSKADKMSQSPLSDDEEYMNEIKSTITKTRMCRAQSSSSIEKESIKEGRSMKRRKSVRVTSSRTAKQNFDIQSHSSQASASKMSTSTKIEDSRTLKRSLEDDRDSRKKRKVEYINNIEEVSRSGATLSSVDDWFKKTEPRGSRTEHIINVSLRESIQNIIEKLDTTLIEINQNTSNKFVHLFAYAQQHLTEAKQQREVIYKHVGIKLAKHIIKVLDAQFSELFKSARKRDDAFMKKLKEQASAVIRDDCQQKRVMVQLLKEDVQAVLDHMDMRT